VSDYRFYHPAVVRYSDLDPQDHVNNSRYLTFFEEARIHYLIQLGLFRENQSFTEIGIIVADAHVIFREPVRFGDPIRVGMRIAKLGHKSMQSEYVILGPEGRVFATGSCALVTFDYRIRKTIQIPDEWRERITQFESGG
jgi:acyl-CoA thioester hydrolase